MKEVVWSPQQGADAGKQFIIKRMDAFSADRWACRVIRALVRAGAKVPDSALEGGITSLTGAAVQIFGSMSDDDAERAFDDLIKCCSIKLDATMMPKRIGEFDIEDASTIPDLRVEAFKLHVDFFKAAAGQISPLAAAIMGVLPQGQPQPPSSAE